MLQPMVSAVKERGMEVEREGGGQYQALPKGMFPTTVKVNVNREASLDSLKPAMR